MQAAVIATLILYLAHLIDKRSNPVRAYFLLVLAGLGWFFIALTVIGIYSIGVDARM
jgi:hypothetical protein